MQGKRLDRVGHLIQMELSRLVPHRLKDPRVTGLITITHVSVAADLRSARVFYSVIGANEKALQDIQEGLQSAAGFLQREVSSVVEMRYTPKFTFQLDETYERSMEIDRVLHRLEKENPPSES